MSLSNLFPIWGVLVPTFVAALLAAEIGYRLGAFGRTREVTLSAGAGTMVGSLLALLAFMLAFTFGSAASRFDARRLLIVDEANAVSTLYLRAELLPSPSAERLRDHVREYVGLRLEAVATPETIPEAIARSEELHDSMWTLAVEATNSRPAPVNSLVLQAVNNVIDLHAERVAAGLYSRVPTTIWVSLLLVAAASMVAVGYQAGLSGPRPSLIALLMMFAFSAVIMLIADLDQSHTGWLEASQDALRDAVRQMHAKP